MSANFDNTILKYFSNLEDPRIERTKQHQLVDIVAIAILAVISGSDTWVAIETYAQAKREWLETFLALPNGIPSHDTIARVFARLNPQAFEQCFHRWVGSITEAIGAQVIPIDGKTVRQSFDRNSGQKAIHVVSAWASEHRLVLGQLKVDSKSNEITAIPKLLELLDIVGCIITIDAMGCQKEIAAQIIAKNADYVLALKANQSKLEGAVNSWFEKAQSNNFEGVDHSYHHTIESAHGRIEIRKYWSVPVEQLGEIPNQEKWSGLRSVGMVMCERRLWNKTTIEVRFYISSLEHDAVVLAHAVRSHWGIENSVHWVLDMTFHEDASRIRKDNAPLNFSVLRRLSLNLLDKDKTVRGSVAMKRYRAGLDNNYLLQVIAAI
ncbi:ISAs1 family transposase [Nostoc sphaeroides]|uniref:ISAs1 family transposase n=1 Tax=Nostoc sphaeroides TaxID=446679 RepID=UPI000E470A8E|nr:ISAs1 family transposase [Nostoc sphaeroides]MCC5628030.1 ISAs1 family transposase [Nostoc sphaeroides CHAB 2801]MCC5630571.1 ISAs1 family transposase [Nostoc sphaeroides CHAB 2801]